MPRALLLSLWLFLPLSLFAGDEPLKLSLEVQAALQQGRKFLAAGEFGSAVRVLEAAQAAAKDDAQFLRLLADAYRGRLAELQKAGRNDLAERIQQQLQAIEVKAGPTPAAGASNKAKVTVRGQQAEDAVVALELGRHLGRADELFAAENYLEAAKLYAEAFRLQRELPALSKERWAYCKLFKVTQQLNEANAATLDLPGLEQEVKEALALAPRFDFGQKLLEVLKQRSGQASVPTRTKVTAIEVRHLPPQGNWQVCESVHFRLHHRDKKLAEEALAIAERTRAAVLLKWLNGQPAQEWTSKCYLFIYPTGQEYSQATGAPPESPGHSSINADHQDARRVHHRRVDLRGDHAHLLVAVLPHEVTHAVLAGQVAHVPIPRWADEGMAVLSETYERIGRHLAPLAQLYTEGRAFTAEQLMQMEDYPDPSRMGAFYGQGVCLVQYLTQQKGPPEFVAFLRTAAAAGYESALRQHYGFGLAELDKRLERFIVHERVPSLSASR